MYSIPNALIRSRIDNSPQLVSGLTLINELIANRLIPDGLYPIIAGGAVRDAVFQMREPHDIDIFLTTTEGGLPRHSITDRLMWRSKAHLFLEDFKEWAEAHGIETRSLLVEQDVGRGNNRYAPGSSLNFIDILEIDYQGAKVQLMFNEPVSLGALAATFPSVCRGFLGLNSLWFPSDGFYAMTATGAIPVCSSREVAYVHKKWPDAEVAYFSYDGHIVDFYCWNRSPIRTDRVSDLILPNGEVAYHTDNDRQQRVSRDISNVFLLREDVIRNGYGADFYRVLNSQWSANLQPLEQEPTPDISTDDTWAMPRAVDTRNDISPPQRARSSFNARVSEFAAAFGAGTNRVNQPAPAIPIGGGAGGNFGANTVSNRWHVEANQVIQSGSTARPWYTNPRTAGVNSINETSARRLGQVNSPVWVDESDSIAD